MTYPGSCKKLKRNYHILETLGSNLVPRLFRYAYEDRIIGFLCETIVGRVATINDFNTCQKALH